MHLFPYEAETPTSLFIRKFIFKDYKICDNALTISNENRMAHIESMNFHQPETQYDMFRYLFVCSLFRDHRNFVDAVMLFSALPPWEDSNVKPNYYKQKVEKVIRKVYQTCDDFVINMDRLVIMHYLERFLTRHMFQAALEWVRSIVNLPADQVCFPEFVI